MKNLFDVTGKVVVMTAACALLLSSGVWSMRSPGHLETNLFNQIFMIKEVNNLYESPDIQVLRICTETQDILCASTFSGGGNEQVIDTKNDAYNSWEWSF